jgi:hypothetical protein
MKKTKKENPITFFRKANEARQAVVKKSIKKAQDGIEMNDDLINKAGSTGGYKKPIEKQYPWGPPIELKSPVNEKTPWMEPTRKYADPRMDPNYNLNPPASSNFRGPQALNARSASLQGQGMRGTADTISKVQNTYPPQIINKQKRGGFVKTKKK